MIQRSLNNPIAQVSHDYVGSQKMNLRIGMSDTVIREKWDDDWLPCCPSYNANPGAALASPLNSKAAPSANIF